MKTDKKRLWSRIKKKALSNNHTNYRVVAIGIDFRGNIISIAHNIPRVGIEKRFWHAEERVIHNSPPTLKRILIARFNKNGSPLPIDPCAHCSKLAEKKNVRIERI